MTRAVLFSSNLGDINAQLAFVNNLGAATDPGATNDISQGYTVGSVWVNSTGQRSWTCIDSTAGAAVWIQSGQVGGDLIAPAGSQAIVTGGAAAATNGNGSSVVLTGGAKDGTGINGGVKLESLIIRKQGTPTAKTVSATLTAAEVLAGIITINQAAAGTSAQQLPTGTALQAALPADFAVDDSFDISVMNISTVDAEDASVTTNTDMTLVGSMDFPAHSGITLCSCGILRFRKTADHAFSVYRVG